MIVPSEQARLILAGRKTQHRVPRKRGQVRCPYRGGGSYAMHSGPRVLGRVFVFHVSSQRIEDISDQEAYVEGFKSRDEFLDYWRETYPYSDCAWVLVVEPEDEIRLLKPAGSGRIRYVRRPGSKRQMVASTERAQDYTDSSFYAMRGEPEAVDEATQQRLTADAGAQWREHQENRLAALEQENWQERLRKLEWAASEGFEGVEREMRVIRARLKDALRRGEREDAA